MFTVLYRWRIEPNKVSDFVEAWELVTKHYVSNFGAHGSRLHRGSDDIYYAYAQWPSVEARQMAAGDEEMSFARQTMSRAVTESFPEVQLEIIADHLQTQNIS